MNSAYYETEPIERVLADEGYDVLESANLAQKIAQALRSEAEVKTEAARKERERLASILQRWAEDLNEPPGYGWRRKCVEWLQAQSSEGEG